MNLVREYKPPRVRSILRKMKMYAEQQGNLLKYRIKSRYDNNPLVHVGSLEYVRGFACGYGEEGGDRIVIVKTNPADVVSVPHDCEYQKVRTAKYLVVSEYTGPLPEYVPDECDEDDSDSFDGIHVSVSCDCDCDCEDEDEDFGEEYRFTSFTSDGHPVAKYTTDDYDDDVLWDIARKAVAAGLKISVIDQDGVELEGDMRKYL
jgi:hypothetical protein